MFRRRAYWIGWAFAIAYSWLWPGWSNLLPLIGLFLIVWVLQPDAWLKTKMVALIALARTVLFVYRGQLTPGFILQLEIAVMTGQAVLRARTHAQRIETLRACRMVTDMISGG